VITSRFIPSAPPAGPDEERAAGGGAPVTAAAETNIFHMRGILYQVRCAAESGLDMDVIDSRGVLL